MLWEKLSAFNVKMVIADGAQTYPRKNNQFIMQVLKSKGYSGETLRRLNRVQVPQQVLFMSDILTASGNKIDINAGIQRAEEDSRLELRWPKEQPTESDFQLWRNALQMICPTKSRSPTVGKFKTRTHRIWKWSWNEEARSLHRLQPDGETEDMCVSGQKQNRFYYSHSQQ